VGASLLAKTPVIALQELDDRFHAERENDQIRPNHCGSEFMRDAVEQPMNICRMSPPLANEFAPTGSLIIRRISRQ
jgi:hypothetical protein